MMLHVPPWSHAMRLEVLRNVILLRAELLIPLLRTLSAHTEELGCLLSTYAGNVVAGAAPRTPAGSARSSASSAGWQPRSRELSPGKTACSQKCSCSTSTPVPVLHAFHLPQPPLNLHRSERERSTLLADAGGLSLARG